MTLLVTLAALLGGFFASAVFSGSETGFYTLSRVRVEQEAREGLRAARRMAALLRADLTLLITILIGNNLAMLVCTYRTESLLAELELPGYALQLASTLLLTPLLFFFGEILPKELFRRRPYLLTGRASPLILGARWAFWPLERLLWLVSAGIARLLGLTPASLAQMRDRPAVLLLLQEGAREGAILPHAGELARNVLELSAIPIRRVMVPWASVAHVSAAQEPEALHAAVQSSRHTRLPVVDAAGAVQGYVHQIQVLARGPSTPALDGLRPLLALAPDTPVDRALGRLRVEGARLALVGEAAAPLGIVTLKDLVEEISGDLAGW